MNGHRTNVGRKVIFKHVCTKAWKQVSYDQEKWMSKILITGDVLWTQIEKQDIIWTRSLMSAMLMKLTLFPGPPLFFLHNMFNICLSIWSISLWYRKKYSLHTSTFHFMIHTLTHSVATWKVTHHVQGCSLRIMWKRFLHPLHHKLWTHMVEQYCLANHAVFIQNSF